VGAVVGAILGALATVVGTWWISVRLDRQKENRQLHAAIGVVATEFGENRDRIGKSQTPRLTLGDWQASKGALAGLALRDEKLWSDLAKAYEGIFDYGSGGDASLR
jgi:hypothetical protein